MSSPKEIAEEEEENIRPSVTLTGRVEKLIPPVHPSLPEKVQIVIEVADHMYKELRLENRLDGANGKSYRLKPGAEVDVTIAAPLRATVAKGAPN